MKVIVVKKAEREKHKAEDFIAKAKEEALNLFGSRRRCGCGDVAHYPNGCGPSGCINRPA